ncbi:hypothetical protein [uncultured Akkermansia sp.]|uniref:hypothetical protein n=1 Tax=uncultured Akkermansia sp. TaxID=512294 RepID=UPI00265D1F31|nr:hypothetical protein [uncultured Akkermansia sp.]
MKSAAWVGFAALAVGAVVFSAYRMLSENPSGNVPQTRLVIEDERAFVPAGYMKRMEGVQGGGYLSPAECLVEARKKGILDGLLDRMDPERSLRLHAVCNVSGSLKEVWVDSVRRDDGRVVQCMFVLGCYCRLRNDCYDEKRFFQYVRSSLSNKKRSLLNGNVEYVFPWLLPDLEHCQWGHSKDGSDRMDYTAYYCGPSSPEDIRGGSPDYLFYIVDHHADGKLELGIRTAAGRVKCVQMKTGEDGAVPYGDGFFLEGYGCSSPVIQQEREAPSGASASVHP